MSAQPRKDPLESATLVPTASSRPGPATQTSSRKKILAIAGLALAAGCGGAVAYHANANGEQAPSTFLRQDPTPMDLVSMATSSEFDTLLSGNQFMMRVVATGTEMGSSLCVDDGASLENHKSMTLKQCDGTNVNQIFRFNPRTDAIYSAFKPGMCVDDGGANAAGEGKIQLKPCVDNSPNQKWAYDTKSKLFYSSMKRSLCMDGGGSFQVGESDMHVWTCDSNNQNQGLEIISPNSVSNPSEMLTTLRSRVFLLYQEGEPGLCLSFPDRSKIRWSPCDANAKQQRFQYNEGSSQIQSVEWYQCVDDMGSTDTQLIEAQALTCNRASKNQRFTFDIASGQIFKRPGKNLCVTTQKIRDGSTTLVMDHCAAGVGNRFKIMHTVV